MNSQRGKKGILLGVAFGNQGQGKKRGDALISREGRGSVDGREMNLNSRGFGTQEDSRTPPGFKVGEVLDITTRAGGLQLRFCLKRKKNRRSGGCFGSKKKAL